MSLKKNGIKNKHRLASLHVPPYKHSYQKLLLQHLQRLKHKPGYGPVLKKRFDIDISFALYLLKKTIEFDILHLHWQDRYLVGPNRFITILKSVVFIFQLCLIKVYGKKIVWTVHNLKNHENRYVGYEIFFMRILSILCDAIIAHCNDAKEKISRMMPIQQEKIKVVPHGNFIDYYENSLTRDKARDILGVKPDEFVFLYLGEIRRYKGLINLVKSFNRLDHRDARLFIVGNPFDKALADVLHGMISHSRIVFVDRYVADDQIQLYMNASDIVVLPYRDILTSGAAILAMSFKRPVIAPRTGCIPELVDQESGILYDPLEDDGLFTAMKTALTKRETLGEMEILSYELMNKFNWDGITRETLDVYEEIFC